mgnify:FL=1|jgi:hypothetical protein
MIKRIAFGVAAGALALAPLSARADWYVNPEFNGASFGDDYLGGTINFDLGYEGSSGVYSYFIQGGPAWVMPNGMDNEIRFAGKFGGAVQASENVSVYGELSAMSGDELSVGSKLGLKYTF